MSQTIFSPGASTSSDGRSRTWPDHASHKADDQLGFPRGLIWGVPLAAMGWLAIYFAIKLLMA